MFRRLTVLCCLLLLTINVVGASRTKAEPTGEAPAAAGEYLVGYEPGTSEAQRLALIEAAGGRLLRHLPALSADLVAFPTAQIASGSPAEAELMSAMAEQAAVSYVEPNYTYTISAPFTPTDTLLSQQYAWSRIDAYDGWGLSRGSANVVIAVIDSGVQLDHPDLQGKLVAGYDFVQNDSDPGDPVGHGTHVAGTAAAATNNGAGVAGTCPECRVMPVRVISATGSGFVSDIAEGIVYAADRGAKVINLSLGGAASSTLKSAVDYAWGKGAFLACAAGNSGTSSTADAYPGAYDNCFAVAATNSADGRASYSNYGVWVEVGAPGDQILSTYKGSTYSLLSGTSMAAPHVAGLAGLLASQGYSNAAIRERICATADDIAGTGGSWSCGRINLERALTAGAPADLPVRAYLPALIRR